jgi:hypothetical protein
MAIRSDRAGWAANSVSIADIVDKASWSLAHRHFVSMLGSWEEPRR